MNYNAKSFNGFTLIELLTIIAIIGVLGSIVVASTNTSREKARITRNIAMDTSIRRTQGDQLVGEWLFNDPDNRTIDTGGHGFDGIIKGSLEYLPEGGFDGSGAFRWTDHQQNINVGNDPRLNPEQFTITAWIKPEDTTENVIGIFSNSTSGTGGVFNGHHLHITKFNGNPRVLGKIWNGSVSTTISHIDIQWGQWRHIAFVYDGTQMILYMDGKEIVRNATSHGVGSPASNNTLIGGTALGNRWGFSGVMDQVRIYSNVLLTDQIQDIYAQERRHLIHSMIARN